MDIVLAQKVANEARRTAVVVGGGIMARIGIEKLYIGLPAEIEKIVVREEILGLESMVEEVKPVNVDTGAVVGVAETPVSRAGMETAVVVKEVKVKTLTLTPAVRVEEVVGE